MLKIKKQRTIPNLTSATELQFYPIEFKKITDHFGKLEIDVFTSRINKQIGKCVTWHPKAEAIAINAFPVKVAIPIFTCFHLLAL